MRSIAYRIYRATILVSVVSVVTLLVGTLMVNEDLENTLLGVEMVETRDFFLAQNHDLTLPYRQENLRQTLFWLPRPASLSESTPPEDLPAVFQGLPKPFSAEIQRGKQTYLVNITALPQGELYLARDISHFEARERLFWIALWVVGALIVLLTVVLAMMAARGVTRPLRRLADQIQQVPVGASMPSLQTDWRDSELATIAVAFNTFVAELEAHVRREKSLLGLASHELRTPISVIFGALDVLEQRGSLSPADQATLARVRRATAEMHSNVTVLLALARKQSHDAGLVGSVSIATELASVLDELGADFPVKQRVAVQVADAGQVQADGVMVRMLLRNLLHNALQHTPRQVFVTLERGRLEIRDEGPGLPPGGREILKGTRQLADAQGPVSGLGLYLVTLLAERLGWRLTLAEAAGPGTVIRLEFKGQRMS